MAAEVMPNLTVEEGSNGNGHRKVRSSSMIWKQSATNSNPPSPALSAQPAPHAGSPSSLAPPGVEITRRRWQSECRPVCDRPPRVFQRAGWHFLLSWQQLRRKNKPGERTTLPARTNLRLGVGPGEYRVSFRGRSSTSTFLHFRRTWTARR